ncbi:hypothetical protein BDW62DRAFT_102465 [Aspergillus aurantiobrunneus]
MASDLYQVLYPSALSFLIRNSPGESLPRMLGVGSVDFGVMFHYFPWFAKKSYASIPCPIPMFAAALSRNAGLDFVCTVFLVWVACCCCCCLVLFKSHRQRAFCFLS